MLDCWLFLMCASARGSHSSLETLRDSCRNRGRVLQLRLNNMHNSFYHAPLYDAVRAGFAGEFEQTAKEIESNKEEVATGERAIEALKVEARAAGIEEGDIAAMIGELSKPTRIDLKTLEPQAPPNLPQGGVVYPYGP